jgi:hypothetical protein
MLLMIVHMMLVKHRRFEVNCLHMLYSRSHVPLNVRLQRAAHSHDKNRTMNLQRPLLHRSFTKISKLPQLIFHSHSCLLSNYTYLIQIVTGSAMDDASGVDYELSNVIPPTDASFSSSLSMKSVVNIANRFQTQLSSKSLIR